jgi:hypothetical protein
MVWMKRRIRRIQEGDRYKHSKKYPICHIATLNQSIVKWNRQNIASGCISSKNYLESHLTFFYSLVQTFPQFTLEDFYYSINSIEEGET